MKILKSIVSVIIMFVLCLSMSACEESKNEPTYMGYVNDIPYYRIKYPEGKGLSDLFGDPNYVADFQASWPVSVYNPNETMVVSGWNISDNKSIIYSSKDYFIVYYDTLTSETFSQFSMMSDDAMEYEDGIQYIEDLLI